MNTKIYHRAVGFIIIFLSLHYAFKGVSAAELIKAIISVRYIYILPAVLMVSVSFIIRAIRWHFLIASFKKVIISRLYPPLMIGWMGNKLTARAEEFIRAYLFSKMEGISYSTSFAIFL
jgi:uncharacterized protein (TIRG00374 family)